MKLPITVPEAKDILTQTPDKVFSLIEIRVPWRDAEGYMVAGYHIYPDYMPGTIQVKGSDIWEYVYY